MEDGIWGFPTFVCNFVLIELGFYILILKNGIQALVELLSPMQNGGVSIFFTAT